MMSFGLPLAALALTGALTGPQVGADRLPGPAIDEKMRAAGATRMRDARRELDEEQAQKEAGAARSRGALVRRRPGRARRGALAARGRTLHVGGQREVGARRRRALLEGLRARQAGTEGRSAGDRRRVDQGIPAEPLAQRREGARAPGAAKLRTAGAAGSRGRRGPEAARPSGPAAFGARAGDADAREDSAGPELAPAEGARALRAGPEQLGAGAPDSDQRRARRRRIPICSGAPSSTWACTAAPRTAPCWRRSTSRPPTSTSSAASCARSASPAISARVLAAATSETTPELRAEAVQQLGVMGAHEELWQLYQKESNIDVKKRILQAMFVGGNSTRLIDLANTEQNAELRRTAIRNLGLMGSHPHRRGAHDDLQPREGRREQEGRHQRLLPAEQRRAARRHRPQGNRSAAASRDRQPPVEHGAVEGGDGLSDGDSEQVADTAVSSVSSSSRGRSVPLPAGRALNWELELALTAHR